MKWISKLEYKTIRQSMMNIDDAHISTLCDDLERYETVIDLLAACHFSYPQYKILQEVKVMLEEVIEEKGEAIDAGVKDDRRTSPGGPDEKSIIASLRSNLQHAIATEEAASASVGDLQASLRLYGVS
jgi:hypothetical protein